MNINNISGILSPGKKKETIQEFGNIKIQNNAVYFHDTAIQISNISRTWIGKFDSTPFPWFALVGLIVGLFILMTFHPITIIIGIAIMAFSGYVLYYHSKQKARFGFQIEMSSGFIAIFASFDCEFLRKIQEAITNDFVERSGTTTINLDSRTIVNNEGIISYGDSADNTVVTRS